MESSPPDPTHSTAIYFLMLGREPLMPSACSWMKFSMLRSAAGELAIFRSVGAVVAGVAGVAVGSAAAAVLDWAATARTATVKAATMRGYLAFMCLSPLYESAIVCIVV